MAAVNQSESKYDCIVIGAGHNGLVCANYLARAGWKVLVLERRSLIGGACVTEPLWPGYKVSTASYVVSLLLPEIVRDLELARHGYRVLKRTPSSFTPLEDGRYLLLGSDREFNRRQIAKFSARDAASYPDIRVALGAGRRVPGTGAERHASRSASLAGRLEEDPALETASRRPAVVLAVPGVQKAGRPFARGAGAFGRLGADDSRPPVRVRRVEGDAGDRRDHRHVSTHLRAGHGLCPLAPRDGLGRRRRGVWGYVEGGMGALTRAMGKSADRARRRNSHRRAGQQNRRGRRQRPSGVVLEDGRRFTARRVASNVDAHLTFEKMLEPACAARRRFWKPCGGSITPAPA